MGNINEYDTNCWNRPLKVEKVVMFKLRFLFNYKTISQVCLMVPPTRLNKQVIAKSHLSEKESENFLEVCKM